MGGVGCSVNLCPCLEETLLSTSARLVVRPGPSAPCLCPFPRALQQASPPSLPSPEAAPGLRAVCERCPSGLQCAVTASAGRASLVQGTLQTRGAQREPDGGGSATQPCSSVPPPARSTCLPAVSPPASAAPSGLTSSPRPSTGHLETPLCTFLQTWGCAACQGCF